jgi:5-oxoprolinase (ATP-hydrolysing) subunit A
LRFLAEGFADRRYRPDGSLVPRTEPNSTIHDVQESVEQVKLLISKLSVSTICLHGDHPEALLFAQELRSQLLEDGVELRAWS